MKYTVIVTPEAQANIAVAFDYIAEHSPINAAKWLRELYMKIDGLEEFPRRFGQARERFHFPEEIRQVIFKSHRIIFTIDDSSRKVHVVFVRHGKMQAIGEQKNADDLPDI